MDYLKKTPGTFEEIVLLCPKCNSNQVTITLDSKGYYEIIKCQKCDYKKEKQ